MASIGHLAVGMVAASAVSKKAQKDSAAPRPSWRAIAFWSTLSFLPDFDVIGFPLGVQYADAWGHRGATHSFVFALAIGSLVGALAPRFGRPALRTGIVACLVLLSHATLDIFTDGGLGCALFWPFDLTRYFAPWTPVPVSPIGLGYLSLYGMFVAIAETIIFAPLFWLATTRRRPGPIAIAAWVFAMWVAMSIQSARDQVAHLVN